MTLRFPEQVMLHAQYTHSRLLHPSSRTGATPQHAGVSGYSTTVILPKDAAPELSIMGAEATVLDSFPEEDSGSSGAGCVLHNCEVPEPDIGIILDRKPVEMRELRRLSAPLRSMTFSPVTKSTDIVNWALRIYVGTMNREQSASYTFSLYVTANTGWVVFTPEGKSWNQTPPEASPSHWHPEDVWGTTR